MTDPTPLYLHRCTVALRAATGQDALICARLVAENAKVFTRWQTAPSIGWAIRHACVEVLEARLSGATASFAAETAGLPAALAITRRVAKESRHDETALGRRARDLIDHHDARAGGGAGHGPALARQAAHG